MKFFELLPTEVRLEILSKLPPSSLGIVAQLSKTQNMLAEDNYLWHRKLIEDFYFTNNSVIDLHDRLARSYKQVYKYCVEYKLNPSQQNAILQFKNKGLTENH